MKKKSFVPRIASLVMPRLGEILFVAVFAAVIGLGPRMMNVDGDLGRHLTLGNYILDTWTIPTRDIFSFTKTGDSLTPHEWLSDVIFAAAHKAGGLNAVVWVTALVLAFSIWIVYKHSLNLSKMSIVALLGGVLCAAGSSVHWLTRPHIFTILFTAIWVVELDRLRLHLRKGWILFPALMLFWVNLHGAFIVGFVIWGAFLVGILLEGQYDRDLLISFLLTGLASLLVTLINPAGFGIWKTGMGFLGNQYLVGHTAEYLPPDFHNPAFWPVLLVLGLSVFIFGLSRVRLNASYVLLTAGWMVLALYSARNIPLYLVVVTPILCMKAAELIVDGRKRQLSCWFIDLQDRISKVENQIRGGALSILIILGALLLLLSGTRLDFQDSGNDFSPDLFPVKAVDWIIEENIPGAGFNYFPWGGYLLYRMWPEKQVFIDGQTDFYGEQLTREYEEVISLDAGWEGILAKYGVKWILMPPDSKLSQYLDENSSWLCAYQDQTAHIYVRRSNN